MSHENIKLEDIFLSGTNPRKEIDKESLKELSKSIWQHGVIQPIVVRELSGTFKTYEIICGERRYRACSLLKIETIPAIIKNVSDDEALELQIIENLERKEVHPLEEADAFRKLLNSNRYTIDDLCAKFAKTPIFIHQRLKLNDLIPELKADFLDGLFGIGHAVEFSKIGVEHQKEFYEDARGQYPTLKDVKYDIKNDSWDLNVAVFDPEDETLTLAGKCSNCMKCSSANPILFPDEQNENICFDKFCFNAKEKEHHSRNIQKIIDDNPAIILLGHYYGSIQNSVKTVLENNNKTPLTEYGDFVVVEDGLDAYHIDKQEFVKIKLLKGAIDKGIADDETVNIKAEIEKISKKANRDIELDRHQVFNRIVNEIVKDADRNELLFNTDSIDGVTNTGIIWVLYQKSSYDFTEWFKTHYDVPKDMSCYSIQFYNFINKNEKFQNISELFKILRAYSIYNGIISHAVDYETSGNAASIYNIVKSHFPKDVELFHLEQNEIAEKRIKKTDAAIEKLEEQLQIREELGVETISVANLDRPLILKQMEEQGHTETTDHTDRKEMELAIQKLEDDFLTPKFEKIVTKKRFALNNSYFKNRNHSMPGNPLEIMCYYKQHGELPFDNGSDTENWLYDCFVEYQKKAGVYNSQFFTPPATALQITGIAEQYFDKEKIVLDACSGFGMLSIPLLENHYKVLGFDYSTDMVTLYKGLTSSYSNSLGCKQINFMEGEFNEKYYNIISNPPYEVPALTKFLECLYDNLIDGGAAVLLIPNNFIDKDKPKALKSILDKFELVWREDMQGDFARTKINAEIVVLEKESIYKINSRQNNN